MKILITLLFNLIIYEYAGAMCPLPKRPNKDTTVYQTYYGNKLTEEEIRYYEKINQTFWCTIEVKKCDPNEWRRIDGTCNNLEYPQIGGGHTTMYSILPPVFDQESQPLKAKSGKPLPIPRRVRTTLLPEGRLSSPFFTQLSTYVWNFLCDDVNSLHDTLNYVFSVTYCCEPKGKTDPVCAPHVVPDDDPVHRFSNIRCLNMTRPLTYQFFQCIENMKTPIRINSATQMLDLSDVYGQSDETLALSRTFRNGLLKTDVEDGVVWPPGTKTPENFCYLNEKPFETRCHDTPNPGPNTLLGLNLCGVWFWRHHNFIAKQLAKINPCWTDDHLFNAAKDINIAIFVQILYYELLPAYLGRDNLIRDGVISKSKGFRDLYNDKLLPRSSTEFTYSSRWLHTMQESAIKMYDKDGFYEKQISITNLTLRVGYVANNMKGITQGAFRQPCAHADGLVDPNIAELGLGFLQKSNDIATNDLSKGGLLGVQPYIKYREHCSGRKYKSFKDLSDIINPQRIELLQELYESPEDIELLSGLWIENLVEGGHVPETFYCIMVDQLKRFVQSDRYWYERPNRPHAFTLEQLLEIRKASISRFMCDIGDTVTLIQPRGFERIGPNNALCGCNKIQAIDFRAWKDDSCNSYPQKNC